MPDIKLARLPDRTPVKLALSVSPELHRLLCGYSDFYREAYGEPATVADLVPPMLESFLAADKAFSAQSPVKRCRRCVAKDWDRLTLDACAG
jgi:hypothetical protein